MRAALTPGSDPQNALQPICTVCFLLNVYMKCEIKVGSTNYTHEDQSTGTSHEPDHVIRFGFWRQTRNTEHRLN